jgi:genome maintenance exonuclease 1
MDYKQSNKLKKEEWIEDYKLQLMAYIMAHNEVYKTDIRRGIIFICTRDLEFQQFEVNPGNFNLWQDKWLERVEKFYQLR